jgi:hypothetical protein
MKGETREAIMALRARCALAGLLGPVLLAGLAACQGPPGQGPVYSVAQVEARLASHPRAWTDRALLLRGVAVAVGGHCDAHRAGAAPVCPPTRAALVDFGPTARASLPLAWAGPGPLLAVARRVPLLSGLLPAPQAVDWGEVAVYRAELRATADESCGAGTCYEALVLDAVP